MGACVYVSGEAYTKLDVLGQGGSGKVWRVLTHDHRMFALKEVSLVGVDVETRTSYENEIRLLRYLQEKGTGNIIELHASEMNDEKQMLYIVMEVGDTDMASLLKKRIDENHRRVYWQEMLRAVQCIHSERIIHSDLKPANFLIVKGHVKLCDFGIAQRYGEDDTGVILDSAVGTMNYMSPETIQGIRRAGVQILKQGPASDVWSLGCILYNMVYRKTPFQHIRNLVHKLGAIVDVDHPIEFPPLENAALMEVLRGCLTRDPKKRPTIPELLAHPFLHPEKNQHQYSKPGGSEDGATQISDLLKLMEKGNISFEALEQQLKASNQGGKEKRAGGGPARRALQTISNV